MAEALKDLTPEAIDELRQLLTDKASQLFAICDQETESFDRVSDYSYKAKLGHAICGSILRLPKRGDFFARVLLSKVTFYRSTSISISWGGVHRPRGLGVRIVRAIEHSMENVFGTYDRSLKAS